ncbi:MAG: lamin tail domain-containing protein, partial [Planctomycetes bacterium]|nr:lamin tail domain-containing protein [Planctomycetota bacterium]
SCTSIAGVCLVPGQSRRHCSGGRNGGGSNLAPLVNRVDQSTNNPAAGEEVEMTVRIRDDKIPAPGNIASVEIAYRVRSPAGDFSEEQVVAMDYDSDFGVRADTLTPLDLFSLWTGRIPAQGAGARVEFYFRVEDTEGLSGTRPRNLCHLMDGYGEGVGPCDREFGPVANGGVLDAEDVTCRGGSVKEGEDDDGCGEEGGGITGERYIACNARSTYAVGYTPRAGVAAILVNEIVASQSNLLTDPSEQPCLPSDACPVGNPDCCRRDEDFVELINTSEQQVDLSECYLSDSFFDPRRWKFPEGSVIPAGARFIVWLDNDGSKCPDPTVSVQHQPCF